MPNIFNQVRGIRPGKSVFDLSYEKKLTAQFGYLYPILVDEVVPGDIWNIGCDMVIRANPLASPVLHPIYVTVHYFYVPYRVLGKHSDIGFDFEDFITGGEDGADATTQPVWDVTDNAVKSLWDYMGFPIGVDNANARPVIWPLAAYNLIWNDYYRDHDIDAAVTIDTSETLKKARWERDYFTTCRPHQQAGTEPTVDVTLSGTLPLVADTAVEASKAMGVTERYVMVDTGANLMLDSSTGGGATEANAEAAFEKLTTDLSGGTATGIGISDLRLSAAIQQWMELSMQGGYRYVEWLQTFFGIDAAKLDARLDRPEYIGGTKQWLITSEVLQTSETNTTPQGTLVGHGISVASEHIGSVRVPEFGLVMGLLCIRPKTAYHQGINRQWLRETRYDFYNPLFAGLAEQEVETRELYCDAVHELDVFGYQARYAEMRTKPSMICGDMHSDFDHWHLGRNFAAVPTLDSTFLECTPRTDIFATPAEEQFIVSFGNRIRAIRPMPVIGSPGLGRI